MNLCNDLKSFIATAISNKKVIYCDGQKVVQLTCEYTNNRRKIVVRLRSQQTHTFITENGASIASWKSTTFPSETAEIRRIGEDKVLVTSTGADEKTLQFEIK